MPYQQHPPQDQKGHMCTCLWDPCATLVAQAVRHMHTQPRWWRTHKALCSYTG